MKKKDGVLICLIGLFLIVNIVGGVSAATCQARDVYTLREGDFTPSSKAEGDAKCAQYLPGYHWCEKSELDNIYGNVIGQTGTGATGTRSIVYDSSSNCKGNAGVCSSANWWQCTSLVCEQRFCTGQALVCCEDGGTHTITIEDPVPELWDADYCSTDSPCKAGEGDCDTNNECLTNLCSQDVGLNYGQSSSMDVCECPSGTTWNSNSNSCVSDSPEEPIQGTINPGEIGPPETISYETENCGFGFFVDGTCTDSCSPASILPESFTYAEENGDVFDISSECPSNQVCCCPTGQIWDANAGSCIVQSSSYCNSNADGETFADLDALMSFKENYGICVDGTMTIPTNNAWLNFEGTGWIWECWSGANDYSRCFAYGDTSGSCGNSEVNTNEECDGSNLNGETCETQGFAGGDLSCDSSCTFDTSNCIPISPDDCGSAAGGSYETESDIPSSDLCSGSLSPTNIVISNEDGHWYWGCFDADGGLLALANHIPCRAEKSTPENCGLGDGGEFSTQAELFTEGLCENIATLNNLVETTNGWSWKCSTTSCSAVSTGSETPETTCGNNIQETGEECDSGLNCANDCTCETGWVDNPNENENGCWDPDGGTYVEGNCVWNYESNGECDLGSSSITFSYTLSEGDSSCGTKSPQTIICPAKLGFFDIKNIVIAIIIVGLVYWFLVLKKEDKKKKKGPKKKKGK